MNIDPAVILDGLTVRHAGMVEPTRAVAAERTVNDPSVRKSKEERMALLPVLAMAACRSLPATTVPMYSWMNSPAHRGAAQRRRDHERSSGAQRFFSSMVDTANVQS
jgi:hypothetical protein